MQGRGRGRCAPRPRGHAARDRPVRGWRSRDRDGSGSGEPFDAAPTPELTERETEVLRLVAEALSNAEIAQRLYIGEATVKTHVSNVLQKLGARDRVAAVVYAHRHGLT